MSTKSYNLVLIDKAYFDELISKTFYFLSNFNLKNKIEII